MDAVEGFRLFVSIAETDGLKILIAKVDAPT
ncbi:hypothetical protein CFII68_04354 [Pseudomonas sp. CFII68]|nr:hypothetical protein CFII68_04354 [Pseudomonas sp. CFII68]